MAIVSLVRDYGVNPCIVRMQSDDSYATITAPGYLTSHMADFNRINGGAFQWSSSDIVLCYYLTGWSFFTLSADFSDLDLFTNGGVTPKQVQESAFNFAPGLGADDAFVVNLSPAVTTLTNGLPIYMVSAFTNLTTTPTLKINGMPALPIVTTSGEPLIVDDIQNGAAYLFIYSSANNNFQLTNPSISNANAYLVQKNYFNYAVDFGAANAYEANFPFEPLVTLAGGLSAIIQIDNTNTGASTLTLNGNTAPIVGISGGALIAGEIIGGGISEFIYSDNYAAFILLNSAITPGGGTVGNGTINNLAYYAASGNTISSLATLNNGVLVTSNTGVPSLLANGTAGYVLTANSGAPPSWQAQGYLGGAVLLNPAADQTIVAHNLTISNGGLTSANDILAHGVTIGTGNYADSGLTNMAVGNQALGSNISAIANTGIGFAALAGVTVGNANTAVGSGAGQINDGISNTYVGSNSGAFLGISSNGNDNSLFGASTGIGGAGIGALDFQGGNNNTFIGFGVTGNSSVQNGAIGIGAMAVADAATGVLSTQYGPGISIGSSAVPVGFRGDGTALPGGAANYWRMKVNDTYYNIPILPDGTTIQWPASGTLATTSSNQQWINITAATTTIVPGNWYIANYTGGTTVFELPTTAAFGTEFRIKMGLAGSAFRITQAAGQQINIALGSSTAGVTGYAESTGPTDYLSLTCLTADLVFGNTGFDGNINLN